MGDISVIQVLLIGVVVFVSAWDDLVGYWGMMYPMQIGFFIGLILGNPVEGIIYGGFFELVFLGMKSIGGAQPPNRMVGSTIGIAFAMMTNQSPEITIAIAFPVALLTQAGITFWFALGSTRVAKIEKLIDEGQYDKASRSIILGTVIHASLHSLIVLTALFIGTEHVDRFITSLPPWILEGFKLSGRILPGVGFAIILSYFFKLQNSVYYFLGFLVAIYLKIPALGISMLAICIAFIQYRSNQDTIEEVRELGLSVSSDNEGI